MHTNVLMFSFYTSLHIIIEPFFKRFGVYAMSTWISVKDWYPLRLTNPYRDWSKRQILLCVIFLILTKSYKIHAAIGNRLLCVIGGRARDCTCKALPILASCANYSNLLPDHGIRIQCNKSHFTLLWIVIDLFNSNKTRLQTF